MLKAPSYLIIASLAAAIASSCLADSPCLPTGGSGTGTEGKITKILPVLSKLQGQAQCHAKGSLGADQLERFFALTEIFETDGPGPDYGHLVPMKDGDGDGRGYCAGLVEFCSNTDDMADVIDEYTKLRPTNPLKQFVPTMRKLSAANSASVKGLEGLPAAWNRCVDDPFFRQAQATIRDQEYVEPALQLAKELGIQSVLGRFILYDSAVQHGVDGTRQLVARVRKTRAETPISGKISERDWLLAFLKVRKAELAHADGEATRAVWSESVPRADALSHMVEDGYWDFCGPITLRSRDWNLILNCGSGSCSSKPL